MSLRRDILSPNHDRGYRSLALFLGIYLSGNGYTARVFGALHSGSGETALQINVIGVLQKGRSSGFLDILASNGHMQWLQRSSKLFRVIGGPGWIALEIS